MRLWEFCMLKDERMKAIYSALREGVTVMDVGTDHALIPIELILSGKAPKCILTDISAPSLEKGVKNAKKALCGDKITAYCTNGTLGVPLEGETDVIIAGMGGELIAEIIEQDPRFKNEGIRLVAQPMSKAEVLREYLAKNGFEVTAEVKVESCGRIYSVISAFYTGNVKELSNKQAYLGFFINADDPLEDSYKNKVVKALRTKLDGLKSAEKVNEEEISELSSVIKEITE